MSQAYQAEIVPLRRQGRFRCTQSISDACGPWYVVIPEQRETVREAVSRAVKAHEASHAR